MSDIKSVLFVCTGNSCRSVMAEGLLKKRLKGLGKDYIEVHSAGVGAMDGFSPTNETIEIMKRESVDVSDYESKGLTQDMIKKSDLILVMEEAHRYEVIRRVPEASSKTYLLKKFGAEDKIGAPDSFNIPDPIGKPLEVYENCFNMIKNEIERIAKIL